MPLVHIEMPERSVDEKRAMVWQVTEAFGEIIQMDYEKITIILNIQSLDELSTKENRIRIKIEMFEGRSEDTKLQIKQAFIDTLSAFLGVKEENIVVVFCDMCRYNHARGGILTLDRWTELGYK